MNEKEINEKWQEVITYATEHATKKGLHTGVKWLEDSFNEYINMTDNTVYSGGGQPGSMHNREVLAGKIVLALGPFVGGAHLLDDEQLERLKKSLDGIVRDGQSQSKGLKL